MSRNRWVARMIVVLQLLLMLGLIGQQEYRWRYWQPIQLAARPVDPEALFRGRYVDLAYAFSRVPARPGWKRGRPVWVRLAPAADGTWTVAGVGLDPERQVGEVLLRGTVQWVGRDDAEVVTGIESYFLSERKARETERLLPSEHTIRSEIVVSKDGRAALKRLLVDGVPAEDFEPR